MATIRQVEKFFEGTGLTVEECDQKRGGLVLTNNNGDRFELFADVRANKVGDRNQPCFKTSVYQKEGGMR